MGSEFSKAGTAQEQQPGTKKADQASRRIELRVHLAKAASADTHILDY